MSTILRAVIDFFGQSAPPKPIKEVQKVIDDLGLSLREMHSIYKLFLSLKRSSLDDTQRKTEISTRSIGSLLTSRKEHVEPLLHSLLELGGCYGTATWDAFLCTLLRFCSLSKLELCQTMFLIIIKSVKSWTVYYLTVSQLEEFYLRYQDCPIASFASDEVKLGSIGRTRYYPSDFVELCYRYQVLINPLIHLQRCMQQSIPNLRFWDNYDRLDSGLREIGLEFFMAKKSHVFLTGVKQFRETAGSLISLAIGQPRDAESSDLGREGHQERVDDDIRPSSEPAWLRGYVQERRTYADRAIEADFISKSRNSRPSAQNTVLAMHAQFKAPLIKQ